MKKLNRYKQVKNILDVVKENYVTKKWDETDCIDFLELFILGSLTLTEREYFKIQLVVNGYKLLKIAKESLSDY